MVEQHYDGEFQLVIEVAIAFLAIAYSVPPRIAIKAIAADARPMVFEGCSQPRRYA